MGIFTYTEEKTKTNSYGEERVITDLRVGKIMGHTFGAVFIVATILEGFYTVNEGHVGIQKTFSEATAQVSPGLHFKVPFVQSVTEMEVRTRKNSQEDISVSTMEQLPAQADLSVNWTVNSEEALDIFRKYGGLAQFESRILTPAINSAAKDGVAKYKAEDIIKNRGVAVQSMKAAIKTAMQPYPITINSVQLEDITFPVSFTNAIEAKLAASQDAIREEHKLTQQKLQAQREVQTAQAQADAKRAQADGEAYRIATVAKAQADANNIIAKSLTPALIQQNQIEQWNGTVPKFVSGEQGGQFLFNLKEGK